MYYIGSSTLFSPSTPDVTILGFSTLTVTSLIHVTRTAPGVRVASNGSDYIIMMITYPNNGGSRAFLQHNTMPFEDPVVRAVRVAEPAPDGQTDVMRNNRHV